MIDDDSFKIFLGWCGINLGLAALPRIAEGVTKAIISSRNKTTQVEYRGNKLMLKYNIEDKTFSSGKIYLSLKKCKALHKIMQQLKQYSICYNVSDKNISTLNSKIKTQFGCSTNLIKNKRIDYDSFAFEWSENH